MTDDDVVVPAPSSEDISETIRASANMPSSEFDYSSFEPIDFSPEYYEKIMKLFSGNKSRRVRKGDETVTFTPTKVFAIEAADQFDAMYPGFGNYKQLSEGTSKLAPGLKMSDEQILKLLTTFEDRGFMEALGRRGIENIPSAAAFAAAAKGTSEFTKQLPKFQKTNVRPLDIAGSVYEGAKAVSPIVAGTVAGVFSSPVGQELGDYVLGEEALATPESYKTMRGAEAVADVLSFSPLLLGADKIVNTGLRDYLANSLSKDPLLAGRDFDFSDQMQKSLLKQVNEARKTATAVSDGLRKRQGQTYEGPPIVNDMFERGVAVVLEGKTAPGTLLRLQALEQILKKSAKDARNDPFLFAFYEALAASGAGLGAAGAAENAPFTGYETGAEIAGSIIAPVAGSELLLNIGKKLWQPTKEMGQGFMDAGFAGASDAVKNRFRTAKAKKGFQSILKELDAFGEIDTPEQLENLILELEKNSMKGGVTKTAGQASKSPVLLAMEDTLKRQFGFLNKQQLSAKEAELESAQRLLAALYANKDTAIGKEALVAAAQVEEALFNDYLSNRLLNAENNLFKSINQLAKSKQDRVSELDVDFKGDITVRPAGLAELDVEDLTDLSERLQNLVIAQKKIARNQQQTLYNQVDDLDIMFFDDEGMSADVPKFVRMLEEEQILDKSTVADDLKNLLAYADNVKRRFAGSNSLRNPTSVVLDDQGEAVTLTVPDDTAAVSEIPLSVLNSRRKEALAIARDGTKNAETRRIAGMFAEAIQDDIQTMEDFASDAVEARQLEALRRANAFSRAFYDVYARSLVGKDLAQTKQGNYRLAFETIGNLNGARPNLNAQRIADIQSAGQFALDNNLENAQIGVDSVHGVMDRIIRSARADAVDPETRTIDTRKLEDWMKRNARLEETFPDIFRDLRDVQTQKALLEAEENFEGFAQATAKKQTGFTTLLRDAKGQPRTNPTYAVQEAFSPGADQFRRLEELISVIPKQGQSVTKQIYKVVDTETGVEQTFFNRKKARDYAKLMGPNFRQTQETIRVDREMAVEGLKSSIFEYFVMGTPSGRMDARDVKPLNPDVIYANLFERKFPTKFGKQAARTGRRDMSVADYLESRGIFTPADIKNAKTALKELAQAKAVDAVEDLGIDFEQAKPILDFALGITGSAIGTRSQRLMTGGSAGPGSIIAAGKGAEAMRNIALRIPESQKMMFTAELLQDPILLAKMLRTYKADPSQQMGMINSLKNYVNKKGFVTLPMRAYMGSREDELPEGDFDPTQDDARATPMRLSPLPKPPVGNPTTQAALPAAPQTSVAAGTNNPQVRQTYAALFPNDPISSMITQQPRSFRRGGIASLME
jgi:hypothetical protein